MCGIFFGTRTSNQTGLENLASVKSRECTDSGEFVLRRESGLADCGQSRRSDVRIIGSRVVSSSVKRALSVYSTSDAGDECLAGRITVSSGSSGRTESALVKS